jgi:hypothetical protein
VIREKTLGWGASGRSALLALSALAVSGCATNSGTVQPDYASVPELTEVPFFSQTAYDCGPAALATILTAAAVVATPDTLIDLVYIDGRNGSLQVELMAATRSFGLLPVPVPQSFARLLDEVSSGRPVLVLQNLGLKRAPVWHYAVVVGFDADSDRVILRSGSEPRRLEKTSRFLRQWQLADQWAFVVASPSEVPRSASSDGYMRAIVNSQRQLGSLKTDMAYDAALGRWPEDPLVLFLAATRKYEEAQLALAADLYRKLLRYEPGHVAARNNLANVLLEQGCRVEALLEARKALESDAGSREFDAALEDTLRRIERSTPMAADPVLCSIG